MIKYTLGKTVVNKYGGHYTELKTTRNKKKVKELLKQDWFIIKKDILIITYLSDSWRGLSTTNKISIIAMILATGIGILTLF